MSSRPAASTAPTETPPQVTRQATLPTTAAPLVEAPTPNTVRVSRVQQPAAEPALLAVRATAEEPEIQLPLLAAHLARIRTVLQQPLPILPLVE